MLPVCCAAPANRKLSPKPRSNPEPGPEPDPDPGKAPEPRTAAHASKQGTWRILTLFGSHPACTERHWRSK